MCGVIFHDLMTNLLTGILAFREMESVTGGSRKSGWQKVQGQFFGRYCRSSTDICVAAVLPCLVLI